jgi:hypothetical protein
MCCNAASVGASDLDHQQRAAERRGSRPGSLPRHLLMTRRMTVMGGQEGREPRRKNRADRRHCALRRRSSTDHTA